MRTEKKRKGEKGRGEGREYNNRQRKDGTEENTGRAMSRKKNQLDQVEKSKVKEQREEQMTLERTNE